MHPRPNPVRRNGFSLVEMMVVLFLMGLLAAAVVVSMPGDESKLRREAERLAARTVAARDEAITGSTSVALVVSDAGYYFERRENSQWQPLERGQLGLTAWDKGTTATQDGAAQTEPSPGAAARPGRARIVFDPVGLASGDAAVRLTRGSGRLMVRISRDGKVSVDAS